MAVFIIREVSLMVSLEALFVRHISAVELKYGLMTHRKRLSLMFVIDVAGR